ncbi:MAG: PAS domain S-box protein, partial [Desulfotignum sp.]|nr:PAS domain S-box protein [Desulfotignum sp.]
MRKLKISHYLMIIFLILSFTINGVITVIFYHTASNQVMQDMKRRLFDIVSISAGHVNGDLHHDLLSLYQQAPQAMAQESATYLELKQSLQQIQDASNDIHFIYTMREKPAENGAARQIMFMVDAESDLQQMAQLGEIYSDASPMLSARFFDLQGPAIEEAVYQDHWGTWLSGYAPFFDSRGQRAGVLGVDISAETIATYQHRILMNSLIFFLWTLPFVMAAALLLGRWFGSPMAMMQRGAEAIASGQLDHRLDIPPGRELAVLAHSMNHMAKSLQQERHNLQTLLTKYRNIFQNATEGIFQSTLDGRLLTANDALVKMLGYDSLDELQHAIDHHIANIYENHDDRRKLIQQLTDRGQVTGVKMRMVRRDGVVFVAEENVHLCDYGGEQEEKTVIEGTIRDITQRIERERAEREKEAALASSRAKCEFLANMSHEIRTPLNAVMGLTDLMRRTILSDIQQQYLQKITISSKSLLAVINDILDFSKIEAGRLELEKAPFSLYDVMTNVSEMFAYKAEEKGLEFLVSIEENLPAAVIGDSVRLGQVLINLVGNAVKFTEQGEVVVRVEISPVTHPADQFTFSVLDTGIGIPENRIEVLFDSFTQADGSITRKHGGTGLGLTISRRLVR